MNSYFGLISVYQNGFLPDNAFSRIHGLDFTGAGVSVLTPVTSLVGGIGIATVKIQFTDSFNTIGGIASVTQLYVSPGISTVGFLTGTNAIFSGIVTANKFVGSVEGNITATNVIGGIGSISQLTVSPGITTVGFLTGTNANFSGIVTANTFKGFINSAAINTNSLIVSPGITTVGFLTGTSSNFSGIVTANTFNGNFTGALVGSIDITNAAFSGNIESILTSVGLLPSTRRIVYVDGGITRTDISDTGTSDYSSISLSIWTDIWDNASIHGISTSGWTRGTAPSNGSLQAILGQKQTFKNVNQVFLWLNSRQSVNNAEIVINLYDSSDSNVGQATNKAVNNIYNGGNIIRLKRGESHSRLSGYLWGQEHYTGHFFVPLCQIEFIEVNLNCSGQSGNASRTSDWTDYCYFGNLFIKNSKFTFNVKNEFSTGYMFQAASAYNESNQTATGFISLYWQNEYDIYNGRSNSNEFNMKIERLNLSQTQNLANSLILRGGSLYMWTRHEDSQATALNINVNAVHNDDTKELVLFNVANCTWILDGGGPASLNQAYGGININIDLTGSNIKYMSLVRTTQDFPFNKTIAVVDPGQSHSPINVNMTPNGALQRAWGLSADALYDFRANTRNVDLSLRTDNLFTKFRDAYPIANKSWYLQPGSVRDYVFNSSAEEI